MGAGFIGVDVGTGSARAGVFDSSGRLLGSARRAIAIWREPGDVVEQSSADIWRAVTEAVREAVEASRLSRERHRRTRLCGDLFARRARRAPRAAVRQLRRRARARRDRVDGSPRGRGRGADQRRRPRGPALLRRRAFARDADAEARVARAFEAGNLCAIGAFPRPHRLALVSRNRVAGAVAVHGRLQIRLSGARAALAGRVLRQRRPWGPERKRLRPARRGDRRPGDAARTRTDGRSRQRDGARSRNAGRSGSDRRACRRARHAWRPGGREARRSAAAAGADPRHVVELHGGVGRAALHRRGLGAAFLRADARPVAHGRRPVGVRRGDRPSHAPASCLHGGVGGGARCAGESASSRAPADFPRRR